MAPTRKRKFYYHNKNHDVHETAPKRIAYRDDNDRFTECDNKRRRNEEFDDGENKKQCTSYYRASSSNQQSTSSSTQQRVSSSTQQSVSSSTQQRVSSNSQQRASSGSQQRASSSIQQRASSSKVNYHNSSEFHQFVKNCPHRSLAFLYQLELSILCLLRRSTCCNILEPLIFRNSKIGHFNNIVLCFNGEYVCIKVQHVDTYFMKKALNFNSMFSQIEGSFTLRSYLNEFAEELLYYIENESHVPKYLILYTNCILDLSEDKRLNSEDPKFHQQLQFNTVNYHSDPDLIDFLFKNKRNCELYRFSNDPNTRNYLSELVTLTKHVTKQISQKGLSAGEIIQAFFDCLIFAVNQPSVEELIDITRCEIANSNGDYVQYRKEVVCQLIFEDQNAVPMITDQMLSSVYSFNLFMLCIHDMFLNQNTYGMKFKERNSFHTIGLCLEKKIVYLKPLEMDTERCSKLIDRKELFSLQSLFNFFMEDFDDHVHYYIIYTNTSLSHLGELMFGDDWDDQAKFHQIDPMLKKFSFLRHQYIQSRSLYQFIRGDTRKEILSLLKMPSRLERRQDVMKFSELFNEQLKDTFLNKVIFAVDQYNTNEIYRIIEKEINHLQSDVPYNCEMLHKIALRYLKCHELDVMTKEVVMTICDDIRSGRSNSGFHQEEVEFVKRIIPMVDAPEFSDFMSFLTKGDGRMCMDILRRNKIKLTDVSMILEGVGRKKGKETFLQLFDLWFDNEGNMKSFLKNLENHGLYLENIANILNGSTWKCASLLKELYDLWFDDYGNLTTCLRCLLNEGLTLPFIASFLYETGANCVNKFKEFSGLWFDERGRKTEELKNLEKCGIDMLIICGVIGNSTIPFIQFYRKCFDKQGIKNPRLKTMEDAGFTLRQIAGVLKGAGRQAAESFAKFYTLFFDSEGKKSFYLLTLERENVNLQHIFDLLPKTGKHFARIFKNLHALWFKENGEKTEYLRNLEAKGKNLSEICEHMSVEGYMAARRFDNVDIPSPAETPFDQLLQNLSCSQQKQGIRESGYFLNQEEQEIKERDNWPQEERHEIRQESTWSEYQEGRQGFKESTWSEYQERQEIKESALPEYQEERQEIRESTWPEFQKRQEIKESTLPEYQQERQEIRESTWPEYQEKRQEIRESTWPEYQEERQEIKESTWSEYQEERQEFKESDDWLENQEGNHGDLTSWDDEVKDSFQEASSSMENQFTDLNDDNEEEMYSDDLSDEDSNESDEGTGKMKKSKNRRKMRLLK